MPRRAAAVTLAVAVAGVLAVLGAAAVQRTSTAFTLGARPVTAFVRVGPGETICQTPVDIAEHADFDRVRAYIGSYRAPQGGPPVALVVRRAGGGSTLATAVRAGGYADYPAPVRFRLQRSIEGGQVVDVCLTNRGTRPLAPVGDADYTAPHSSATAPGGGPAQYDWALFFERAPRSRLATVPAMLDRATRFRPGWVGAWAAWLIFVLAVAGVPAALAWAVSRSAPD